MDSSAVPAEHPAGMPAVPLRRGARTAVSALFLANGLVAGLWSVFVPVVQGNLGIKELAMGLLILFGALGGFGGLMLSGLLIARTGSRPVAVAAGLLMAPGSFDPRAGDEFPARRDVLRPALRGDIGHGRGDERQWRRCRAQPWQGGDVVFPRLLEPWRHAGRGGGRLHPRLDRPERLRHRCDWRRWRYW